MENVKSVKQSNGKRLKIQKRLLLVNIDELHRDYKKKLITCLDYPFFNTKQTRCKKIRQIGDLPRKKKFILGGMTQAEYLNKEN